ncbi:hypothetical protein [Asticcacaulis sp. AC402]|uniref:hypothetical protein n=1 Tax=Asticcacaulis sp. AC402 TaxID=1282361 RepID=UPI0003C3C918|nr:hypothetical protein [Asticcacaulis sp. AC402]ESQ77735.1 hypothetical protein ABAC402_00975 [Asticcacaulis sp. AC402]
MTTRRSFGLGHLLLVLAIIAAIIAVIWFYNKSHTTTVGDHVGEAIDAVPTAASKAIEDVRDSDTLSSVGENLEEAGDDAAKGLQKAGKSTSSAMSKAKAE